MNTEKNAPRRLAVVTRASSGIGDALAQCCASDGWDAGTLAEMHERNAAPRSGDKQ